MSKNNLPARHGDIDLIKVDSIPEKAKKVNHTGEFVLQEGETTGHKHRIHSGDFVIHELEDTRWVEVINQALITHEDHRTYEIPAGFYKQAQELEYDPFGKVIREVQD